MKTLRKLLETDLASSIEVLWGLCEARRVASEEGQAPLTLRPEEILVDGARLIFAVPGPLAPEAFGYTAPELFQGGAPSLRTELFSLGVMLYELIVGQRPFSGRSPLAVKLAVLEGRARSPIELAPRCPEEISALCLRLIAKQPELRPSSYDEVLSAVGSWSEAILTASGTPGAPEAAPTATSESLATQAPPRQEPTDPQPTSAVFYSEAPGEAPPLEPQAPTEVHAAPIRYEVQREIARGGRGRVSLALDKRLQRPIAVKELLYHDQESRERFWREAIFTARLQHPSIIPMYDAGQWPSGDPFYAMKMVSGQPLSEAIAKAETLKERLALLPRVLAACEAIAYAHSQKIIHRDLKPHNILVGEFGETVVIDWGLAKEIGAAEPENNAASHAPYRADEPGSLTQIGAILGTPAYMPPEQARGEALDARADVYSLGAILYHLLSGHAPYSGTSLLQRVIQGPPPPLDAQGELPRDLSAIVAKSMAREARERYPSARELAADLSSFLTGQLVSAYEYSRAERLRRFIKRYKLPLGVGFVALVVLIVLSVIYLQNIAEKERLATSRADDLSLLSAKALLETDPARSLSVLASLSDHFVDWGAARIIAADALSRPQPQRFPDYSKSPLLGYEAVAVSPDGRWLAYGTKDFSLRLLDLKTHREARLLGHTKEILMLSFIPGRNLLASLSREGVLRLWPLDEPACAVAETRRDCRKSQPYTMTPTSEHGFWFMAVSMDGRYLAWSFHSSSVVILDLTTQEELTLSHEGDTVSALAFSPDGRALLALYTDGFARLWEPWGPVGPPSQPTSSPASQASSLTPPTEEPSLVQEDRPHQRWARKASLPVWIVAFSPDSKKVAIAGSDTSMRVYDAQSGQPLGETIRHPGGGVASMEFSPDSATLAYVGYDDKLRLLELNTWRITSYAGHTGVITQVAFSADGAQLFTVSADATARIWSPKTGRSVRLPGGEAALSWVRVGGERLFAGGLNSLLMWSLKPQELALLPGISPSASSQEEFRQRTIAFSPGGDELVYVGPNNEVRCYQLSTGKSRSLGSFGGAVTVLATSSRGIVAVGTASGEVSLFSLKDSARQDLPKQPTFLTAMRFSPDGERFVFGGIDGAVRVWGVQPLRELRELVVDKKRVYSLSISSDNQWMVAGSIDGGVYLSRLDSLSEAPILIDEARGGVVSLVFSRDNTRLFVSETWSTKIFAIPSGERLAELNEGSSNNGFELSPNEDELLILDRDLFSSLWSVEPPAQRLALQEYQGGSLDAAFLHNGEVIATAGVDGNLRLWDTSTGEMRVLYGHQGVIYQIEVSPDRKTIATASLDGTVRLWDDALPLDVDALRARLREESR